MPFSIMVIENTQRILVVLIAYRGDVYTFNFAMQRRPKDYEYLYAGAMEKIPPPDSIETCLTAWPDNLERIDYEKVHIMINASRDRYDEPSLRFINELYIRGYPQPTYELAMKQAIRWCQGILMTVFEGKDFDVNNLEKDLGFEGAIEWYQIV